MRAGICGGFWEGAVCVVEAIHTHLFPGSDEVNKNICALLIIVIIIIIIVRNRKSIPKEIARICKSNPNIISLLQTNENTNKEQTERNHAREGKPRKCFKISAQNSSCFVFMIFIENKVA